MINFIDETQTLATINDVLRFGISCALKSELYYGHGTDNAFDDLRSLILRSLHLPYDVDDVLLQGRLTLGEKEYLCAQLDKRINQRIPVPYLIGEAYFCGLPFYVDERVLIPRSPIAELIQNQFSPWVDPEKVTRILDLCTGSGCIAIACCEYFPNALVDAVDISPEALLVAKKNQERFMLQEQLRLIKSDCFAQVEPASYDIIVSNPPYVSKEEMSTLPQEYQSEPVLALQADEQGLAVVNQMLRQAASYLSDHGILVIEVGNSEQALAQAYPNLPFTWVDLVHGGHGVCVLTKKELVDFIE